MDEFRDWLRAKDTPEAHLDGYVRGAGRVTDAAAGSRPMPKHLDQALADAERGGATAQQLANLKRIGDAYLLFLRERSPGSPSVPPSSMLALAQARPRTGGGASAEREPGGGAPQKELASVLPVPELAGTSDAAQAQDPARVELSNAPAPGQPPLAPPARARGHGPGHCALCGGAIEIAQGHFSIGKLGGLGSVVGAGIGFFFGCLGGLTVVSIVGALSLFVAALGSHLACGSCGAAPNAHELTPALTGKLLLRRILLAGGGLALSAAAFALVSLWITAYRELHRDAP